jgi:DedD protein
LSAPSPEPPPVSAPIVPDTPPASAVADDATDSPQPAATPSVEPPAPVPALPPVIATAAPPPVHLDVAPQPPPSSHKAERKPAAVRLASKPVARAKPVAKRPAPAAPPHGRRWIVQLGAFRSADHANLLVNTLAVHGQPAHVRYVRNADGQGWFYVQTPPYGSAAAARSAAQALSAREHVPTYLIKLPGDAG